MKTKLICLAFCAPLTRSIAVELPVIDIGVMANQIQQTAQFVEMLAHLVHGNNIASQQLTEAQNIFRVLGDPATVTAVSGLPSLVSDLSATGSNIARIALVAESTALDAQNHNGGGLFRLVGNTFRTLDGDVVRRQDATYLPHSALTRTILNHDQVERDVLARRQRLRGAIQETIQALQAATTDAEVQKLHGVQIGLEAELATTDQELNFASQQALLQSLENSNNQQIQEAAAHEEQAVEFMATLDRSRQLLRPPTAPVRFSSANP